MLPQPLLLLLLRLFLVSPEALPVLHAEFAVSHHLVQQWRRVEQGVLGVQAAQQSVTKMQRGTSISQCYKNTERDEGSVRVPAVNDELAGVEAHVVQQLKRAHGVACRAMKRTERRL